MSSMITGRKFRAALLLCSILLPLQVSAVVDGEINTIGGPKIYDIDLMTQNVTNNTAGATIPYDYNLGAQYSGIATCLTSMTRQSIYYTATASLLQAGQTAGYLKLNDYMDVRVEIFIVGNQYLPVPFTNISNGTNGNPCQPPTTQFNNFDSGSRGKVTFMITKPIINGVNLRGSEVAQLYGRIGNTTTAMGPNPMAIIRINSGVITVPDRCVVNAGTPINVDFGTIPSSGAALDGNRHSQNVPIKVQCEGGSFATGNLNIRLGVQAPDTASFNHDYLATQGAVDRSNLGIVLKDTGGNLVAANRFYNVSGFANNQGTWNLIAAPIAQTGTDVLEGDFSASATIVAEFQ
ncbi:fimbrial protein [uncultured Cedecea sp.]|uniref:fimbrial protein n=1 Tax=uncultured Cedecea sp. TaxID=988762 RepID=UPI00261FFBB1|nr:fimbrial protein [uncultured Cedecea sp.]